MTSNSMVSPLRGPSSKVMVTELISMISSSASSFASSTRSASAGSAGVASTFERAMAMKPGEIKVIYNLAVTYEKLRLFDQAKSFFQQVANMVPKNAEEKEWVEKAREKAK